MIIDGNSKMTKSLEIERSGDIKTGVAMKMDFLKDIRESGEDFCPCKEKCPHHANCFECVQVHRGHRDHLPLCMWDMLNERINNLSNLTEGSFASYGQIK